jgi:hypothetical protein
MEEQNPSTIKKAIYQPGSLSTSAYGGSSSEYRNKIFTACEDMANLSVESLLMNLRENVDPLLIENGHSHQTIG